MDYPDTKDIPIPEDTVEKWQQIVNRVARLADVPVSLIMRACPPRIEVFRSSDTADNPYESGDTQELMGGYCEQVIVSEEELCVEDATRSKRWEGNPDVEEGMISYYGLPLRWPDGDAFGTICVLDTEQKIYDEGARGLLQAFQEVIETQLELIFQNHLAEREKRQTQQVLDVAGDILVVLDREGRVKEISEPGCALLGYDRSEIVGREWIPNFTPEKIQSEVGDVFEKVLDSEMDDQVVYENPVLTGDGERRLVRWHSSVVNGESEGQMRVVSCGSDITERQRAEELLREHRQLLELVLECTGDGILVGHVDDTFSYVNKRFAEMWNIPDEVIISGNRSALRELAADQLKDPESFFADLEKLDSSRKEESTTLEMKDGRMLNRHSEPLIRDGDVVGRVWSFSDVTQRKRAEDEALTFRKAVESCTDAIGMATPEGKHVYQNRAFDRLFGDVGEDPPDAFYVDEEVGREVFRTIMNGDEWVGEVAMYDRDGNELDVLLRAYPVEKNGDIAALVGVHTDITRTKNRREELRRARNRYRSIFELSPEAIVLLDKDGRVVDLNQRLCEWLGFEREEMLGMFLEESKRLPEESKKKVRDNFERRLAGEAVPPYKVKFVDEKGEERVGLLRGQIIRTNGDELRDLVLISDITEQEQTQRELEDALQELRDAQQVMLTQERQRVLTQMASGIAHDFNNALSTITGFTELLLEVPEKLSDKEVVRKYLKRIQMAASNAAETVRRMRKFYRPREEEPMGALDLNNLVEESLSMTRPRWRDEARAHEADIEVEKDFEPNARVRGNEAELQEMLTNLIFNAVDAMPEGGTLSFATSRENNMVRLEVSDTGEGMSEEVREKCLDPFFTTKEETGTGLGLSTVQGILRRHDGDISLTSEEEVGTTFHIWLPEAEPGEEEAAGEQGVVPHTRSLKILVAEDELEQRTMLREYLEMDDHKVDVAENGREALEKFLDGWYDVVITDRSMPEIGGDSLAKDVKDHAPGKPVIMVTGFGDMMDAAGEKPDGADLIVSKPVGVDELRQALTEVLNDGGNAQIPVPSTE